MIEALRTLRGSNVRRTGVFLTRWHTELMFDKVDWMDLRAEEEVEAVDVMLSEAAVAYLA